MTIRALRRAILLVTVAATLATLLVAASPALRQRPRRHQAPKSSATQQRKQHQQPVNESLFEPEHADATTQYTQAELALRPCVVVRFYNKQANALPLLLFSLFASAHPHLKALVIDTGKKPYARLSSLLQRINRASGKIWVHAYDKKTDDVRAAFPDFHHEDYGYVLTDMVLEDVLQRRDNSASFDFQCDTLTFTNADNLYSPRFIPAMLKSIASEGKDLVASHFVSHYPYPAERSTRSFNEIMSSQSRCGALRSGEDAEFVTSERFFPWCVDLGSVMFTTKAVERANLRFLLDKLRNDPTGDTLEGMVIPVAEHTGFRIIPLSIMTPSDYISNADGMFFYRLALDPKVSSKVLRKVLLLHL